MVTTTEISNPGLITKSPTTDLLTPPRREEITAILTPERDLAPERDLRAGETTPKAEIITREITLNQDTPPEGEIRLATLKGDLTEEITQRGEVSIDLAPDPELSTDLNQGPEMSTDLTPRKEAGTQKGDLTPKEEITVIPTGDLTPEEEIDTETPTETALDTDLEISHVVEEEITGAHPEAEISLRRSAEVILA